MAPQQDGDVESQYDYFGARYYDARIGRWLSVDPLAPATPQWTPYRYGYDDPINSKDHDGRIEWPVRGSYAVNKETAPNRGWGLKDAVVRTSTYLDTNRPKSGTNPHSGIDYRATEGTPFRSLGDGKVVAIGEGKTGGRFITVEYGNGDNVTFRHINAVSEGLIPGSEVSEGQVLGNTGKTGTSTAHLHIDATNEAGKPIDPEGTNYGVTSNKEFYSTYGGDSSKLKAAKSDEVRKLLDKQGTRPVRPPQAQVAVPDVTNPR